jgi:hypothetical protein
MKTKSKSKPGTRYAALVVPAAHPRSILDTKICWKPCEYRCKSLGIDPQSLATVTLAKHPDSERRSRPWGSTSGACDLRVHQMTDEQRIGFCMSTALGMIFRDGVDPRAVHAAMWGLKEYRAGLPPDTPSPDGKSRADPDADMFS